MFEVGYNFKQVKEARAKIISIVVQGPLKCQVNCN